MAHLHFASGWWNYPRFELVLDRYFTAFPLIKKTGYNSVCCHGEFPLSHPTYELNYYVYAALAEKADATPEEIVKRFSLGDLYGSDELITRIITGLRLSHRINDSWLRNPITETPVDLVRYSVWFPSPQLTGILISWQPSWAWTTGFYFLRLCL